MWPGRYGRVRLCSAALANAFVVVLNGIKYLLMQVCVSVQVIFSARRHTPPEWHPEWREPCGRPAGDDAASPASRSRAGQ